MAINLTTKERIKTLHRAITTTQLDPAIDQLIAVVSRQIERWLDCAFLKAQRTEIQDVLPLQGLFTLKAFPVDSAASFTIKNAWDSDFAGSGVVAIAASDYRVDYNRGRVTFRGAQYSLVDGPGTIQFVYTGGIATTTALLIADAEYGDLVFACEQQVLHNLMRTPNFGSPQRQVGGGGQNFEDKDKTPFIPVVVEILEQFRRG